MRVDVSISKRFDFLRIPGPEESIFQGLAIHSNQNPRTLRKAIYFPLFFTTMYVRAWSITTTLLLLIIIIVA